MPDLDPRPRRRNMVSDHHEMVSDRSRGVRLQMILERALALVLAFSAVALPALAQSPPSSTSQISQESSTLQPSNEPQQQSTAMAVIPTATMAPPEYRVGEGDVLGITVYNMPQLNRTVVVGSDGTIVLSYLSRPVAATGKTALQVGSEIALELKTLQVLVDPQVNVAVVNVESKPVVVGGSVRNPQVLQEVRPLTLQQALMLAGGPETGAGNTVLVTRPTSSDETVSYDLQLSKVLSGTNPKSNIPIKPGDTIQVLPDQTVFVAGDVKNPGAFPLGPGQSLTVSKLMALTHGWKADAKPAKAVIVREEANGQRQTVPVDLPKIMARKQPDITLEANDLLYVPDSTGKTVGLTALKGVGGAIMLGLGYLIIRP